MKLSAIICLAILSCATLVQPARAQWRKIADFTYLANDGNTYDADITCVYFLDLPGPPRIGFAGTDYAGVWKTVDGGESWTKSWINNQYPGYATDICFKDSLTGWVTFAGNPQELVLKTTNGGLSWTVQRFPRFPGSIYYCAATNRLFIGSDSIFVSTDLGNTWQTENLYNGGGFSFSSLLRGLAVVVYSDSVFGYLITSDGGVTWDTVHVHDSAPLGPGPPLAIPNSPTCFSIATSRVLVTRSDDYGYTWRTVADWGPEHDSNYKILTPAPRGVIRGELSRLSFQSDSGIYVSTDEGVTWRNDGGPPYSGFVDMFYSGKGITIAGENYGGYSYGLWKEDWPEAGVAEPPCIDSNLSAISISENPLHEATTLHFTITDAEYVRVEVFDVLGATTPCPLLEKVGVGLFAEGVHQIPIDFSRCASGTYYLRLTLGTGEVRTIKLVKE